MLWALSRFLASAFACYNEVVKRNLLLLGVAFLVLMFIVNSTKRISSLRDTSKKVSEVEQRLEALRLENQRLKEELDYKRTGEFKEGEIRNKLGLVKPGEAVVVLPNKDDGRQMTGDERQNDIPNYLKWWNLFFRT